MTESACTILTDIRARYQGTPILTLAQTALWDDPIKAIVKGLLDEHAPSTRLVLGIMDTDYFSRLPKPPTGLQPFDVLPHNDGSTRDLWAAVGEMHSLLGAETPLPVHTMTSFGVRCCVAAGPDGHNTEMVDRFTEAWGWRGLAQTRGRRLLAGDVPLRDAGDALVRQVEWAISETAKTAARPLGEFAVTLRSRTKAFVRDNPDAALTDFHLDILPLLYETLLGYAPAGLEYTKSSELLRFNRWTANRARFRPLDLFVNPGTSAIAKRFYNEAVHGGGISTLDRFGPDALPFDVAIPGRGRGTLHLGRDYVHVDTDEPIDIPLRTPITTRRELAVVLEDHLGEGVALLGKAVVLITMLAGEYIFLFNETGSPYVPRSCRWNYLLSQEGLGLQLYPILRLGVRPWDEISRAGGELVLPEHMARSFGAERISTSDFQARWRGVINESERLLETIRSFGKPTEWLDHLSEADGNWPALAAEYTGLRNARREHGRRIRSINEEGKTLLDTLRRLRAEANDLEHRKGRHWRACVMPARDAGDAEALGAATLQRADYQKRIASLRAEMAGLIVRRSELAELRNDLQSDTESPNRLERMRAIEGEAEREKARVVRNAWMTAQALDHSQPRPSSWWFPTVDPSGAWFRAVGESAELRWQTLTGEACIGAPDPAIPTPLTI